MTGARRAELAALRWTDVDDDGMLTIDSAIEVIRHPGEQRELRDAPTKTGNARRLTLDPDTLNAIWALRREREPYGPWMPPTKRWLLASVTCSGDQSDE